MCNFYLAVHGDGEEVVIEASEASSYVEQRIIDGLGDDVLLVPLEDDDAR